MASSPSSTAPQSVRVVCAWRRPLDPRGSRSWGRVGEPERHLRATCRRAV